MLDYRARMYENYVNARETPLAPATVEGMKPRKAYMRKLIRDHFPADKQARVFDLGCGHGTLLYFAREEGYKNILGVDVSAEQVEAAHRMGITEVQCGDLMDSLRALPDGSQDVVIAFDVIEHFTRSELLPFIDEVRRVLRKDGRWLIHAPNGESPFIGRIFHGDFTHEQAFTQNSLKQLLFASQFSSVQCFEDLPIAHGLKSGVRRVLWKAIRSVLRFCIVAETGDAATKHILSQNFLTVARR